MFFEPLKYKFVLLAVLSGLVGCVSGSDELGLASVASTPESVAQTPQNSFVTAQPSSDASFATEHSQTQIFAPPRVQKTYLINGLASSVESIGYGFTNLSRKIRGSSLHNYASFIESSTIIRSQITRDIRTQYARNPNVEIKYFIWREYRDTDRERFASPQNSGELSRYNGRPSDGADQG